MAERYGRPIDPHPPVTAPAASYEPPEDDEVSAVPVAVSVARSGGAPHTELLGSQVQEAQEKLQSLRRQQEQIERQKRELEELSRKQEDLEQGRTDLIEKLTRALVVVERQTGEAQKRVELLRSTNDSFNSHLQALESINPKSWASTDLQRELSRALGMVDHARTEYGQQKARFAAKEAGDGTRSGETDIDEVFEPGTDHNFLYWLKAGVAFTLPLVVVGVLALILIACYWATHM